MKNRLILFGASALLVSVSASAQVYQGEKYIAWPNSQGLAGYVSQWNAGTLKMEDENFFISRVKPKARFRNAATQVDPTLTAQNDKRLVWWVPLGDTNSDNKANALPNGKFDSEAFSMWSYIDHFGDWTSPHGWAPGGFADAAHKNGVAVSGVASIPFGGISTEWSSALTQQAALNSTTLAQFLHYHGVDGLGYNSEFSGNSAAVQKIAAQHGDIITYLNNQGNHVAEHIWYDGTNYNGSISFDQGLGGHNSGIFGVTGGKRRASLFFNYNWNYGKLEGSVTTAQNMGIDPMYVYAGFNQQGNDPGTNNWVYLSKNRIGIGLWGAHANNMFFAGRNSGGSAPQAMQRTYLTTIERFFGNGPQNPAIRLAVKDGACANASADFFGMSAMMSARSTLSWNLSTEPFITYFNLGNGQFFNWMGARQANTEWYSIGIQDYLPTWRYWWAPTLLGRNVKATDIKLNATFSWNEAFLGGSCLKIAGTQAGDAYLHLFKTQFELAQNDVITLTYKLNEGAADISLVLTAEGAESTPLALDELKFVNTNDEADDELWVTKTYTLARGTELNTELNGKTLALVALKVTNADKLDLNLGQFSIVREKAATPAAPEITLSKVIAYHRNGIDGKVIFNMANDKPAKTPVYNSDVNTSMFRLWFQEEGKEPINTSATTSWAGMFYSAPYTGEGAKVRFGVSAVAIDLASESEIAWGEWTAPTSYAASNDIAISKTVIKPGQAFSVSYADPKHTPSKWTVYDQAGTKLKEVMGLSISFPEGLENAGGYDLVIDENTASQRRLNYYIQITGEEAGAIPEIRSISVNGTDAAETAEVSILPATDIQLAYTGRQADGHGSRGLRLNDNPFGVQVSQVGIGANESFSIATWVKLTSLPVGLNNFITVEDRGGSWPANNWDFFWSRVSDEGKFVYNKVDTAWGMRMGTGADGLRYWNQYNDSQLVKDVWAHVAIVIEYQPGTSNRRSLFYINGVLQKVSYYLYCTSTQYKNATAENQWANLPYIANNGAFTTKGANTYDQPFCNSSAYPLQSSMYISIGGTAHEIGAISGVIDDFQVWKKAMTADDVKLAMNGLDPNNLPAEVTGFWDFESDANANEELVGIGNGTNKAPKAIYYEFKKSEGEGQKSKAAIHPSFDAGSPFINASSYEIKTIPSWTAKRATIKEANGTDKQGAATLSYAKEGDYNVTLTLTNGHGSDSRTFPVIRIGENGQDPNIALDQIQANNLRTYTVGRTIYAEIDGNEAYTARVINAASGALVATRSAAPSERALCIDINTPGVYLLQITSAQTARTVKLIVK